MSQQETFTSEQKQLEQFVSSVQDGQSKVAAAPDNYINALVTAGFTVGPDGANLDGWITYTQSGKKIQFQLDGIPTSYWGLFAGGAPPLPFVGALPPEEIGGKVGEFEARGAFTNGVLVLWFDGRPVFNLPLPLVGAGPPILTWGAKGRVRFSQPVA